MNKNMLKFSVQSELRSYLYTSNKKFLENAQNYYNQYIALGGKVTFQKLRQQAVNM